MQKINVSMLEEVVKVSIDKNKDFSLERKFVMQHIFIVGAKSMATYGGYETFVYKLTEYHQDNTTLKYHIFCKANGDGCMDETKLEGAEIINDTEFIFHNAHCLKIQVPKIGSAQAIYYDVKALNECCTYIKKNEIRHPIVYILACRIGPFAGRFYRKIHMLEGKVYLNPDGHEWMRKKWGIFVRKYWKISEQLMIKNSDLVICDSKNIEKYIREHYDGKGFNGSNPKTTFIAYGAETRKSQIVNNDPKILEWYQKNSLKKKDYYLVVGRFIPENNYETMIREFMRCHSKKSFTIITSINDKFLKELEQKLHFKSDNRIKFVGAVYDQELLMKIRENAYGYFHGHEVGGTNPSLLEALSRTDLCLLLSVEFNREVAKDAALYWSKNDGSLASLIDKVDVLSVDKIKLISEKAKARIRTHYSWEYIADKYAEVFLS